MSNQVTQSELESYVSRVNEVVKADYASWSPNHTHMTPVITVKAGRKYAALRSNSSAFGFVDMTNGDVLYAASWKAPAKNFARGNIRDENGGTKRIKWTGVF